MSSFLYCTFNGIDLTALTGVTIDGINKDNMPQRTLMRYPLARADGQVQIGGFFSDKEINVSGEITVIYVVCLDGLIESFGYCIVFRGSGS